MPLAVRSTITRSRAAATPVVVVAVLIVAVLGIAVIAGTTPLSAALAVALLVPAAVVDIDEYRLPDAWVMAALTTFVAALAISAAAGHEVDALGALAGAAAMGVPVLALHLVSPTAMGFGDVKVALILGAAIGSVDWRLALVGLCVAALSGAATGIVARSRTIAFGPHLVLATVVMLVASDPIVGLAFTDGSAR